MKTLLFTLLTCFGLSLFASGSTLYRDEDTGFLMRVPSHMNPTWHLSNMENGIECNVFQSDADSDLFCFIATGKVPLKDVLGEGIEGFFPALLDQIQESLSNSELENFPCRVEMLPSLAREDYSAQRFRIDVCDEEKEEFFHMDMHLFVVNTYAYVVATGMLSSDEEEVDSFTKVILDTICFTEE